MVRLEISLSILNQKILKTNLIWLSRYFFVTKSFFNSIWQIIRRNVSIRLDMHQLLYLKKNEKIVKTKNFYNFFLRFSGHKMEEVVSILAKKKKICISFE